MEIHSYWIWLLQQSVSKSLLPFHSYYNHKKFTAVGKIEIQRRKGEPIPHGWAHDTKGQLTTDASLAFESACLAPLGGSEITSGYKGYGLGAMIEVLCGILSGALFSNKVRKWTHVGSDAEANLGQFFIAINPNCFAPGFTGRLSELNNILRNLTPVSWMWMKLAWNFNFTLIKFSCRLIQRILF